MIGRKLCALVILVGASAPALAGASGDSRQLLRQPAYERAAQQSLPQSRAPLWATLAHANVGEDNSRGVFTIAFPPEVETLNGRAVELTGFMLPLDRDERSRHFLLSRYTPVCLFCPPGAPNEVVEVNAVRGIPITDRLLKVSGRLVLTHNADNGLFFQVNQASVD
jgi:hypothetical protein